MRFGAELIFLLHVFLFETVCSERNACILLNDKIASHGEHEMVSNDGFCDCADGSDEKTTSACSYVLKSSYTCPNDNAVLNNIIPNSRLQDGVCDCCDGSDEIGSLHGIVCENRCEKDLLSHKESALTWHENVLQGLQVKRTFLAAYQLKQAREKTTTENSKIKKVALNEYLKNMKIFLKEEIQYENSLRFQLLRERETKCADGHTMYCDIFKEGYFDSAELVHYTGENHTNNKRNNERFHKKKDNSKIKELEDGFARVKSVICENPYLLPDGNSRVFEHLGEYMTFVQSSAGQAYFKTSNEQSRKNSYYRQIIENGSKRSFFTKFLAAEFFGILFSPATYGFEITEIYAKKQIGILYEVMEKNSRNTDSEKTEISPEPYSSIVKFYEYANKTLYQPNKEIISKNYLQLIEYYNIVTGMVTIPDFFNTFYTESFWFLKVMFQTRKLYYGFYYENLHEKLPCKRHACLIRNGIKVIEEEILKIDEKLNEELELQKIENDLNNGENGKNKRKEKKLARDKRRIDEIDDKNKPDKNSNFQNVDFGPKNSWEASLGKCIQGMFGEYEYQFCYFDRFKQGSTLLGTFLNWGTFPLHNDENTKKEKKNLMISDDEKEKGISGNSSSKFSYQMYGNGETCQVGAIIDGMGRAKRRIQVIFKCGPAQVIEDIIEREVCVYEATIVTPFACSEEMEKESYTVLRALGVSV